MLYCIYLITLISLHLMTFKTFNRYFSTASVINTLFKSYLVEKKAHLMSKDFKI